MEIPVALNYTKLTKNKSRYSSRFCSIFCLSSFVFVFRLCLSSLSFVFVFRLCLSSLSFLFFLRAHQLEAISKKIAL